MSFWSGRAQVEPLAALAAVLAVCIGLTLYAGAVEAVLVSLSPDRAVAPTAADRLVTTTSSFGSMVVPLGPNASSARPAGYELNATVVADGSTWTVGPTPPDASECARRRVSVRIDPATVRPGTLEVCVWPVA
jgi:hypothetical protein